MGLESFAVKGLLSLCLRCLACEDAGLRGLAYEVVALYSAQLDAASLRQVLHGPAPKWVGSAN